MLYIHKLSIFYKYINVYSPITDKKIVNYIFKEKFISLEI